MIRHQAGTSSRAPGSRDVSFRTSPTRSRSTAPLRVRISSPQLWSPHPARRPAPAGPASSALPHEVPVAGRPEELVAGHPAPCRDVFRSAGVAGDEPEHLARLHPRQSHAKLEDRADALGLQYRFHRVAHKVMDVTALAMALAMDFAYTGRLTG